MYHVELKLRRAAAYLAGVSSSRSYDIRAYARLACQAAASSIK